MALVRGLLLVMVVAVVGSEPVLQTLTETLTETLAETLAETPAETPAETLTETLAETLVETPAETLVEAVLSGEGQACVRGAGPRCGAGLECFRADKKNKVGVCRCKSEYEVCGSDGQTYTNPCVLKSANDRREKELQPVTVKSKGRCPSAPLIVTPPGEVYNVSGSQVFLSCEAVGIPTPVLTWYKVVNGKRRVELLPGDRDNLAIQTRGGPEKHEVTGWVLISPLLEQEQGSYECRASNSLGVASALGSIHLVQNQESIPVKREMKDQEL